MAVATRDPAKDDLVQFFTTNNGLTFAKLLRKFDGSYDVQR